jgi:KDO2-lipid IV(A) lauroyltransferase
MLGSIRHLVEYGALRAALWPLDALPLAAAARVASAVADLAWAAARSRRRLAVRNVLAAGVCGSEAEARRIARESFRHFAVLIAEALKAPELLGESSWSRHVRVEIPPETRRLLEDPAQGLILATGHLGCWEVGAQALSHIKPVTAIARPMNNPYADRLMNRRRASQNFRTTPKRGPAGNRLLDVLRRGEVLALMMDQHARDRGLMIEFFGRPAATFTSPARLHLLTGAPIVFGHCFRTGPAQYLGKCSTPIARVPTADRESDLRAILEELTRRLEAAVREKPEQYLWAHRRWRVARQGGRT